MTRKRFIPDDEYLYYVNLISERLKEFINKYDSRKELVFFLESDIDNATSYFDCLRNSVNIRKRIPNKNIMNYFKKMFSKDEIVEITKQYYKNPYANRAPKETNHTMSSKESDELRRLKRRLNRELIYEKEYEMIMKGQINVKKKGHQINY